VPAPAEADEGGRGIVEAGLAGTRPPFPPFALKRMDVIARSSRTAIFIGLCGKWRQYLAIGGQGGVVPPGLTVEEGDIVGFLVESDAVIRQVIVLRDVLHHLAKAEEHALCSGLLEQGFKRNRPCRLFPAMLARQFVDAAFKRFAEPEVVGMQGQYVLPFNRIENPV